MEVELEICASCKREIPHQNYVLHTAHCARNIVLCKTCKEPISKSDIEEHQAKCFVRVVKPPVKKDPPTPLEQSSYFSARKEIEDKKVREREAKRLERLERLIGNTSLSGSSLGHISSKSVQVPSKSGSPERTVKVPPSLPERTCNYAVPIGSSKSSLIPCQYCELELPKLDLEDHESYCGARTEKCELCNEPVMFRDRNAHRDGHRNGIRRPTKSSPVTPSQSEKLESSRDISRRLDSKTEYIRNLLHDSASITVPLRSTGAIPRNRGSDRRNRRRDPPTEIVIPCEFCDTPIPHEELIEHETGCRPDLARYQRRARSPEPYPSREASSPDVDIPCEYCSDLIAASEFLQHQATCGSN